MKKNVYYRSREVTLETGTEASQNLIAKGIVKDTTQITHEMLDEEITYLNNSRWNKLMDKVDKVCEEGPVILYMEESSGDFFLVYFSSNGIYRFFKSLEFIEVYQDDYGELVLEDVSLGRKYYIRGLTPEGDRFLSAENGRGHFKESVNLVKNVPMYSYSINLGEIL